MSELNGALEHSSDIAEFLQQWSVHIRFFYIVYQIHLLFFYDNIDHRLVFSISFKYYIPGYIASSETFEIACVYICYYNVCLITLTVIE